MKRIFLFFAVALAAVFLMGCAENEAAEGKISSKVLSAGVSEDDKAVAGEDTEVTGNKEVAAKDIPDGFRVITVGSGSPPTEDGRSWPATLVQYQDKNFLVDCGGGCVHGLEKAGVKPSDISNILFTHHHADHDSDFLTMLIAGWGTYNPRTELNVFGAKGTEKFYELAMDFYDVDIKYRIDTGYATKDGIIDNVDIKDLKGGEEFELDGVKISTVAVPHSIEAVAFKFEVGDQSVVVTGDTKFSEDLIKFSKDAELVIMDGMLTELKEEDPLFNVFQNIKPQLESAHISLKEIGQTAATGNYKKIVLTHLFNGKMDIERTTEILREQGYKGEVIIAESLKSYEIE